MVYYDNNKALARVASFLVERDFFRFLTARKLKRRQKHRPTIKFFSSRPNFPRLNFARSPSIADGTRVLQAVIY